MFTFISNRTAAFCIYFIVINKSLYFIWCFHSSYNTCIECVIQYYRSYNIAVLIVVKSSIEGSFTETVLDHIQGNIHHVESLGIFLRLFIVYQVKG